MQRYQNGFRQLIAWREAHKLTLDIYRITKNYPKEERYGIVDQMRRASSSISAQLAEGAQMETMAHRRLFYKRAYGSAAELDYFLELSHDLGYIDLSTYKNILESVNKTSMLIARLSQTKSLMHLAQGS